MNKLPSRRAFASLAAFVLPAVLLGCSAVMKPVRVVGLLPKDLTLQVLLDADANDSTPIAVDVVAVQNKKAVAELSALTAEQWFARRTDFQRMKGRQIAVHAWEWVPGETVPDIHMADTVGSDAVLLFARYSTKGEHRAVLPAAGRVVLQLKKNDFALMVPGVPPATAAQP